MRGAVLPFVILCAVASPRAASADGPASLLVDDFSTEKPDRFPARWQARDPKTAERVYTIASEHGDQFLHAVAHAQSAQIGVSVKASCAQFPVVTWRWRITEIPAGSDERVAATNDSAAGVYVVFKGRFGGLVPRAIKYVWSAREPRGAAFPSPGYS